jgi:hypothetical protein
LTSFLENFTHGRLVHTMLSKRFKHFLLRLIQARTSRSTTESPSRLYLIPHVSQLEKIHLVLTTLHYEIVEQSFDQDKFQLISIRKLLPKDFLHDMVHPFGEITLNIDGALQPDQKWRVRIVLQSKKGITLEMNTQVNLILENIALILGWQDFWVIEIPPPSVLAA